LPPEQRPLIFVSRLFVPSRIETFRLTHPITGIKPPKTIAPKETPAVKPALIKPRTRPLDFSLANSNPMMMASDKTPAAPVPAMTLPATNAPNEVDTVQIIPPVAIRAAMGMMRDLGGKMVARRPATGAREDIGMR
jgi:hypothetical protein